MSFEGQEHNLRHTSIDKCLEIVGKAKILNEWLQKLQVSYVNSHNSQAVESQEIEKFT